MGWQGILASDVQENEQNINWQLINSKNMKKFYLGILLAICVGSAYSEPPKTDYRPINETERAEFGKALECMLIQKGYQSDNASNNCSAPTLTVGSTATLTVRSNVYNDRVFIDGTSHGSTRLDVKIPYGLHRVKIVKRGYSTHDELVYIKGDMIVRGNLTKGNQDNSGIVVIGTESLHNIIKNKNLVYTLIDAREANEYSQGHLPTAVSIPYSLHHHHHSMNNQLPRNLNQLLIFYCHHETCYYIVFMPPKGRENMVIRTLFAMH